MAAAYPVRVEARLEQPSRWLWLVKWLLAVPHYFVLAFLWAAYVVLSIAAFFAILFAGRYPRAIFEFNVGVLRWSWRVAYYAYGALGTDRYPPFTLEDVPDYPAHLDIEYPAHLSRGLVLVKWWLLAIPHYLVVGLLLSGGWLFGEEWFAAGGVIGVLVLVAAIVLAFTGEYPRALFDVVLGLNRWVLRVAAYAGLMTDEYPPFRVDTGETEPGGTLTVGRPQPEGPPPPEGTPLPGGAPRPPSRGRWTGGRIASLVIGSVLIMCSLGGLAAGGAVLFFDQTQRDADGFVTVGPERLVTATYALTTEDAELIVDRPAWRFARSVLGTVRVRATPVGESAVFVGIAERADVDDYLGSVERAAVTEIEGENTYRVIPGRAPELPPGEQPFWAVFDSGTGTRTVAWDVEPGEWTLVVMNEDAGKGIDVRVELGAEAPVLGWIAAGLLIAGCVGVVLGVVMVAIPVARAGKERGTA